MKWLTELMERTQGVRLKGASLHPAKAIRKGETVIDTLPDSLKKLYIALQGMLEENRRRTEANHAHLKKIEDRCRATSTRPSEEELGFYLQSALDCKMHDVLESYVWLSIKRHFCSATLQDGNIDLRDGWQVVTFSDDLDAAYKMVEQGKAFLEKLAK